MPHLSWNEVRECALRFARNPENARALSERSHKQTFWNDFFAVFGLCRSSLLWDEIPLTSSSPIFTLSASE